MNAKKWLRTTLNRQKLALLMMATVLLTFALLPVTPARAQVVSTSPGMKNVYASGNVLFSGSIADITATMTKGKKHMVVEIEAQGEVLGCGGDHVSMRPFVNDLEPNFTDVYLEPNGVGVFRTNAGVWWLDLDAAEELIPGTFINQPLDILLRANSAYCPNGATFSGTVRARLVKK